MSANFIAQHLQHSSQQNSLIILTLGHRMIGMPPFLWVLLDSFSMGVAGQRNTSIICSRWTCLWFLILLNDIWVMQRPAMSSFLIYEFYLLVKSCYKRNKKSSHTNQRLWKCVCRIWFQSHSQRLYIRLLQFFMSANIQYFLL